MSTTVPQTPSPQRARYDLLAVNLVVAVIAALLLAAVGGSVKVVQLLEKTEVAGVEVSLAVGAAVNPGVLVAAVAIFFAMLSAVLCTWSNRLQNYATARSIIGVLSWTFTVMALMFFVATLILVPLSLAVQVGL